MKTPASSRRASIVIAIGLVLGCGHTRPAGQGPIASLGSLQPGWNRIAGGPHTTCAFGTPYAYFVEIGDPQKLMIYFQGGGGCWDAATCDPHSKVRMFKPAVADREQPYRAGLLDPANPENPVRGYTKVFVPYCTADLHLGARTVAYDIPASRTDSAHLFEIHHSGTANAMAAIDWAFAHVPSPRTILVTGESAGSVPTPVYAAVMSKHYPRARVVALGDGSGAFGDASGITRSWRGLPFLRSLNALPGLDSATLTYPGLYGLAARSSSRISVAEINSAEDSTQSFYLRTVDPSSPKVSTLLAQNYAAIKRDVPSFRSFTVPGVVHTMIPRPQFYTTSVDGVRLRDWVDALINGAPPCMADQQSAAANTCVRDVGASLVAGK
jgi:hypothetical protein